MTEDKEKATRGWYLPLSDEAKAVFTEAADRLGIDKHVLAARLIGSRYPTARKAIEDFVLMVSDEAKPPAPPA